MFSVRGVVIMSNYRLKTTVYLGGKMGEDKITTSVVKRFISKELDGYLPGYTLSMVQGMWQGQEEPCYKLEYIGQGTAKSVVLENMAGKYKEFFKQECVLIEYQQIEVRILV